MIHNII